MNSSDPVANAVTALFVPGNRPERFAKAAASGADVVIIDLEDAVASDAKVEARHATVEALTASIDLNGRGLQAVVRVNASGTAEHEDDLTAILSLNPGHGDGLLAIMLPKAEKPAELARLTARLPERVGIVALIESALGLVNAEAIAATPGIDRLAFGAIDYVLDINASDGDRFLDPVRVRLVAASRAAGLAAPLDSPSTNIRDTVAVAASAGLGRDFGFGGKLCIHPSQIDSVAAAYRPNADQLDWAHRVLSVEGDAAQIDGEMIDRPVTERARRILAWAGSIECQVNRSTTNNTATVVAEQE